MKGKTSGTCVECDPWHYCSLLQSVAVTCGEHDYRDTVNQRMLKGKPSKRWIKWDACATVAASGIQVRYKCDTSAIHVRYMYMCGTHVRHTCAIQVRYSLQLPTNCRPTAILVRHLLYKCGGYVMTCVHVAAYVMTSSAYRPKRRCL